MASANDYYNYFASQSGSGLAAFQVYHPPGQSGSGLGQILRNTFRFIVPFLFPKIAKHGIEAGKGVYKDVKAGKKFLPSVKTRGLKAVKNVGMDVAKGIVQGGSGKKRKRAVKRKKPGGTCQIMNQHKRRKTSLDIIA